MTKTPPQYQEKFVLRLPDGMRDRIKLSAEANHRSMNAEVIALLEQALASDVIGSDAALSPQEQRRISSIVAEIASLLAARALHSRD